MKHFIKSLLLILGMVGCGNKPVAYHTSILKAEKPAEHIEFEPRVITIPTSVITSDFTDKKHIKITIIGIIVRGMSAQLAQQLTKAALSGADHVEILLNSPGGDFSEGTEMVTVLHAFKGIKTTCIVDGEAASMAFYFLQGCDERMAVSNASLMAHELYLEEIDDANRYKLREMLKDLDQAANIMNSFEAKRMKMSLKDFEKEVANKNWVMNAQEALKNHAIDKIIEIDKPVKPSIPTLDPYQ